MIKMIQIFRSNRSLFAYFFENHKSYPTVNHGPDLQLLISRPCEKLGKSETRKILKNDSRKTGEKITKDLRTINLVT